MKTEHERAYIFTVAGLQRKLPKLYDERMNPGLNVIELIEDRYLDRGLRVRQVNTVDPGKPPQEASTKQWFMTEKTGSKADGHRLEKECEIPEEVFQSLASRAKLTVTKNRQHIPMLVLTDHAYDITVDFVGCPMNIVIVEVESRTDSPVPENVLERIFGLEAKSCPLSAFELFNRKIGICGGPSAGKSETAKIMSHTLNTKYQANAFHVVEYATSFIQKYHRSPTFYDQMLIWFGQREREQNATTANLVISDCPTFLGYIYMLHLNNKPFSEETALHLSKVYKRVLFDLLSYTDIILMELQEYRENGIRYQNADTAKKIEARVKGFLDDHGVKYSTRRYWDADNGHIVKDLFYVNE